MSVAQNEPKPIQTVLEMDSNNAKAKRKWILLSILGVCVLVLAGWYLFNKEEALPYQFKTDAVTKGPLTIVVTATGQLKPVNQVEVGTEVSGTVRTVHVDFNDHVKKGEILAKLDTTRLDALVLQSKAALSSAEAKLQQAQANLSDSQSNLKRLEYTWKISGGKVPSQHDLDAAKALLKSNQAEESMARSQIFQAQATLNANQADLTKATIVSPIDGIVLERNVEPGQTVAASLQTPVLFTLAEDLAKMTLYVNIDEADVGQVHEGQSATFNVDAYPSKTFVAKVTQVRFAPQTEGNVVTYEALLAVDNPELLLRPGMTATADITVQKLENVLLVPNAALRFSPPQKALSSKRSKRGFLASLIPHRPHGPSERKNDLAHKSKVYILKDEQPVEVKVSPGLSNGIVTEIKKSRLKPGDHVIIGMLSKAK